MNNLLQDGYSIIDGFRLQQHPDCKIYFKEYLQYTQPSRILELGTANGGLTYILRSLTDIPILTVDKNFRDIDSRVKSLADILTGDFYDAEFQKEYLIPYISQPGRTLVLCDAYNKVIQYITYVKFIKPGDIIAVHDYFKSKEYFEKEVKGKTWNWCMITDKDMHLHNLMYNMEDFFPKINKIFWTSKIKKPGKRVGSLI